MVPHNKPTLGYREISAVKRVINSGWVAQGIEVNSLEDEIAAFLGLESSSNVVVVSSGTAALFLALWALESKGRRVGVPVYSCSALKNAIEMSGAVPVYLDCAKRSPNIDLNAIQSSNIDILIAPSMFGIPIDIKSNSQYKVIEDLAQAFGAEKNGRPIGSRGELGITSFYATKLLTTGGQGGAIFSHNKNLIDKIRDYREFDNRRDKKNRFNFQMTDIQASIGREQLKQFNIFRERRESIFMNYKAAGLDLLESKNISHSIVRYRAVINTKQPDRIINQLEMNGIRAIVPIEKDELLDNPNNYINAKQLSEQTVSLPIYPNLEQSVVNKICRIVSKIESI
jgi:perosamine synthetase